MRQLTDLLRRPSRVEQGRVLAADATTVTVVVGGRTRRLRRLTALSLKVGDRINLQGDSIVGKRKAPPTGAVFEI
jgi:hypothetical protein